MSNCTSSGSTPSYGHDCPKQRTLAHLAFGPAPRTGSSASCGLSFNEAYIISLVPVNTPTMAES